MKRTSSRAQDRAFGQWIAKLRKATGLSQAGLAQLLSVSRNAVSAWETGHTYPTPDHFKHVMRVGVEQRVFTAGREAKRIRALWHTTHQTMPFDEQWVEALLGQQHTGLQSPRITHGAATVSRPQVGEMPQLDWDDALDVPTFYGRDVEQAQLSHWMVEEGCRVISIFGMGGIGKSALAVTVMRHVAPHFEVVIWRSLRDAPTCDVLLESCLQVLAPRALLNMPESLEDRLRLLMEHLRERRVLLVLDNGEMVLEDGTGTGQLRVGYEGYAKLFRQISETAHQGCLLLTSREKLADLVLLEGSRTPVRSLRLVGLDAQAGAQLLVDKDLVGSAQEQARLVEAYSGNPLALKIVAQTIVDVLGGNIRDFLAQGDVVFGGVRDLLDEQFQRLSLLELHLVYWFAILREPATLPEVLAVFRAPPASASLLEALDGLHRRSLIERGKQPGSFTLQSVVLEYASDRLVMEACTEIEQGSLDALLMYGLTQAHAKDYVRRTQEQMLLVPLLHAMQRVYPVPDDLEMRCLALLDLLRDWPYAAQGYGPTNLLALLNLLRGDLRGLNLSRLALRSVFLQGISMQDADLSHSVLQDSVVNEAFDEIFGVTIGHTGTYWAAVSRQGKVQVWEDEGRTLRHVWHAYPDVVRQYIAFSPDGRTLACGSYGGGVKLWDVERGTELWSKWLTTRITSISFSPDGHMLGTTAFDGAMRFWNRTDGSLIAEVPHPGEAFVLAWSPDEQVLGSGDTSGTVRLWQVQASKPVRCVHTLVGHTHWATRLAFAPDGTQLVSASYDGTVKLWDVTRGACLDTFTGHTNNVVCVVWSPDGRTVASSSADHTIWLWDIATRRARAVLRGHMSMVSGLAFTPDSSTLVSGSDDGTVRVWDVETYQCLRIMAGHVTALLDLDWSPDGTQFVSGGADTVVTMWDRAKTPAQRGLRDHPWIVRGVAWHPGGQLLASDGHDNSIRLWDTTTGALLHNLRDPDGVDTIFQDVAWSPDGGMLACSGYAQGVQVWEMTTRTRRWVGEAPSTLIRRVAWSPDGKRLAGGGGDGAIYVLDAQDGSLLIRLGQHSGTVMSVAWSPDGRRLASGGGGRTGGELFVWDVDKGERMCVLAPHAGIVSAVAWSPDGEVLVSGSNGMLRWWKVASGVTEREQAAHEGAVHALKISPDGRHLASCGDDGAIKVWDIHSGAHLQMLRRDRPYERMNIAGVLGITDAQRASLLALGAVEQRHD